MSITCCNGVTVVKARNGGSATRIKLFKRHSTHMCASLLASTAMRIKVWDPHETNRDGYLRVDAHTI